MNRKKPKFFRRGWNKVIRIGKHQKKKRKWRRAYGRDNKMRLKEKGYARIPSIGWGADKKTRIKNLEKKVIMNIKELENEKGKSVIIGKVGMKRRQEIIAMAKEMKIKILNRYKERKNAA